MIKTLAEIIVNKVPQLVIGDNFFIGKCDIDTPANSVTLYLRAQTPSYQVPNYTEGLFLFEVRNVNWFSGSNLAKSIAAGLNGLANCSRVMVENHTKTLTLLSATVIEFESIGQDPNGLYIHYVTALIRFQET
jgi:hypothetical protein